MEIFIYFITIITENSGEKMRKNKKILGIICLTMIIATVSLTGCIKNVTTLDACVASSYVVLKGAAPLEHNSFDLVNMKFVYDDEAHEVNQASQLSSYDLKIDGEEKLKRNGVVYFEANVYGLDEHETYYFRAVAQYAVLDGTQESTFFGEELDFSIFNSQGKVSTIK
jgi:hypothetical protein